MRTGKAIRFSSILVVLLGSNLCASAARAAGAGDAAAQGGHAGMSGQQVRSSQHQMANANSSS